MDIPDRNKTLGLGLEVGNGWYLSDHWPSCYISYWLLLSTQDQCLPIPSNLTGQPYTWSEFSSSCLIRPFTPPRRVYFLGHDTEAFKQTAMAKYCRVAIVYISPLAWLAGGKAKHFAFLSRCLNWEKRPRILKFPLFWSRSASEPLTSKLPHQWTQTTWHRIYANIFTLGFYHVYLVKGKRKCLNSACSRVTMRCQSEKIIHVVISYWYLFDNYSV